MTMATRWTDSTGKPIRHTTNVIEAKVVQVIQVMSRVGQGSVDDPVGHITEYYDMDGKLLARNDAWRREADETA